VVTSSKGEASGGERPTSRTDETLAKTAILGEWPIADSSIRPTSDYDFEIRATDLRPADGTSRARDRNFVRGRYNERSFALSRTLPRCPDDRHR
jgi:hypothetical protein